jgi:hypothetical protein
LIDHYLGNASLLRDALQESGLAVYGGTNAPYIWVEAPKGYTSWQVFDKILSDLQVVITPGAGFGAQGEGYFRVSAFNSRANAEEVARRFKGIRWCVRGTLGTPGSPETERGPVIMASLVEFALPRDVKPSCTTLTTCGGGMPTSARLCKRWIQVAQKREPYPMTLNQCIGPLSVPGVPSDPGVFPHQHFR